MEDEEKQKVQTEAVSKMIQKQMGRITYIREELKRLRHRAAVAADELHQSTENLADPEVLGNKKNKEEFEAHNQAMIDKVFGEIETLGLAQEKEKAEEEEKDKEKKKAEEGKEEEVLEEEPEKCLKKFDKGCNAWLSGLSQVQLEKVVNRLMNGPSS